MKQGSNQRRSRGRSGSSGNTGGGGSGGARRGGRNQSFDSNGPEVKVRGSAQQVLDKYLQLARDAQSSGDRVKAEGYLQFAEHYYRVLNIDQEGGERQPRPAQSDQGERAEQGDKSQGAKSQGEQKQGEQKQGDKSQGEKARGDKPPRGRRRSNPVKNEATLAAEAAAANEARAAGNNGGGDPGEAQVESTVPTPAPVTDTDADTEDDTPEAANA